MQVKLVSHSTPTTEFTDQGIELLNNYDPEVIAKIVSAMNDTPQSVEDAEKK